MTHRKPIYKHWLFAVMTAVTAILTVAGVATFDTVLERYGVTVFQVGVVAFFVIVLIALISMRRECDKRVEKADQERFDAINAANPEQEKQRVEDLLKAELERHASQLVPLKTVDDKAVFDVNVESAAELLTQSLGQNAARVFHQSINKYRPIRNAYDIGCAARAAARHLNEVAENCHTMYIREEYRAKCVDAQSASLPAG